jgi:hypothetical protein
MSIYTVFDAAPNERVRWAQARCIWEPSIESPRYSLWVCPVKLIGSMEVFVPQMARLYVLNLWGMLNMISSLNNQRWASVCLQPSVHISKLEVQDTNPNDIHGPAASLSTYFQVLMHNALTGGIDHISCQWKTPYSLQRLALIACQT